MQPPHPITSHLCQLSTSYTDLLWSLNTTGSISPRASAWSLCQEHSIPECLLQVSAELSPSSEAFSEQPVQNYHQPPPTLKPRLLGTFRPAISFFLYDIYHIFNMLHNLLMETTFPIPIKILASHV